MQKTLFRKELEHFQPYVPGKPIEEVMREYGLTEIEKLASNENQLGPSPKAMEAIANAIGEINFYPESSAVDLKRDLSANLGVKIENLVIGNGGEELLSIIAQTFINEGDEVIVASPSFGIYNTTTSLLGGVIRTVPLKNYAYDIHGFLDAITDKTKLIYICSPNNPTGNIVDAEALDTLYNSLPDHVVVILDEAYFEFASIKPDYPDGLEYLKQRPQTVILRTFSKAYGIAGLRIGYLITSPELAKELNKAKLTFNVNRLAQEGARGALRDVEFKEKTVALNYQSMERMEEFFNQMGFEYIKSYANFIFVDVKKHSKIVFEELLKRGIIIRPGYFWGWDHWIRVSTGRMEQTEKFIQRLQEVLEQI